MQPIWRTTRLLSLIAAAAALAGCGGSDQASSGTESGGRPARPAAFAMCATCHATEVGQNRLGPTLHGVAGRRAGSLAGFAFSPAMRDSHITWTRESLDRFLADPRAAVPGTRMAFAGIADDARRGQVVDYLMTLDASAVK